MTQIKVGANGQLRMARQLETPVPHLSLISSLYLYGVIGGIGLFAVALFCVSLITNLKR